MPEQNLTTEFLKQVYANSSETVCTAENGKALLTLADNGEETYFFSGRQICRFYSCARTIDGRIIDTRKAERISFETGSTDDAVQCLQAVFKQGSLILRQECLLYENGRIAVRIVLHDEEKMTVTNFLAPFVTEKPYASDQALFSSLDQKMLLVPYDNDMWSRYESSVPACGRESYDVTAIYDEDSLNGLIIGALDFDVWKNAIQWNPQEARSLIAFCGAADAGTHDVCSHTPVSQDWVSSSRFTIFWSDDIRRGMEAYGDLCTDLIPPRQWPPNSVPFGWNSYSALPMEPKLSQWKEAGNFIESELPNFCDDDGETYINLDGAFGLDQEEIKKIAEELHAKGQKAGWYLNPCCWFPEGAAMPAEGTDLTMSELFLKDENGEPLPAVDGLIPLDVTHPMWERMVRAEIQRLLGLGMDYIKFDFLSHGSLEGRHYRREYTGRMALNLAYRIIADEIDKANRDVFISLSISPLFPYFLGNSRRCACDSFGHHEDVRYVLNALNFSWWTSGRLYQYNDPDHIPLYRSAVDGREPSTENEARSRYYASVISGTVMLLSDNYGPEGDPETVSMSRKRASQFANDPRVNEIARMGKAFTPLYLSNRTSAIYTLSSEGRHFAAIFNFEQNKRSLSFDPTRGGLPARGSFRNICDDNCVSYDGRIEVNLEGWDAVILEITEEHA